MFGIKKGLKKTKESFFEKIVSVLKRQKVSEEELEEIEELLIMADVGIETVEKLISKIRDDKIPPYEALKTAIFDILNKETKLNCENEKPCVITVVGVNGTGKTTTCAKLAKIFKENGKEVVLAAADTFRAGAINQLKIWAERSGSYLIAHTEGADPGAVAYDAVAHAKAKGKDAVIIDTAGRLHNKKNLMEELRKIHRVVKKEIPTAPHETLLVIDATTGQNGLVQARVFKEIVNVTGIVLTKLDGTAKGGIVISIVDELGIPIKFVGVGEGIDDLKPFDPKEFVDVLFE